MSDSRRALRLPVALEVHVTSSSDHNFYTGFTHNISEGGLFIATSHVLPVGTELQFQFRLESDPEPVSLTGIVRWVREPHSLIAPDVPPGMGVQFAELGSAAQTRINRFIERRRESIFFDLD